MSVIVCKAVEEGDGNQVAVPCNLFKHVDDAFNWVRKEAYELYFRQADDPIPAVVTYRNSSHGDVETAIERVKQRQLTWEITPICEEELSNLPLDEFAAPPYTWNGWITWRGSKDTYIFAVNYNWGIHSTSVSGEIATYDWAGYHTWVLIWTDAE